jgi:hypothetical protein
LTQHKADSVQFHVGGHFFKLTIPPDRNGIMMQIDDKAMKCQPREIIALGHAFAFICAAADPDYATQVLKFDEDSPTKGEIQ